MAITTTKVLQLAFTTTSGKSVTISVANPREDLTKTDVEAAMNTILEKNIFLTSSGELGSKRDARIVGTSTEDLYDPPLN
ncbi:MAG: DUF2922 domain-containing protein [Desulfitobacterium sp.]